MNIQLGIKQMSRSIRIKFRIPKLAQEALDAVAVKHLSPATYMLQGKERKRHKVLEAVQLASTSDDLVMFDIELSEKGYLTLPSSTDMTKLMDNIKNTLARVLVLYDKFGKELTPEKIRRAVRDEE